MATGLVSVVLPAFNEEDCILKTIDDVARALTDAHIPHEIIVVDDGSTDRTVELAQQRQVRLVKHRRNLGVGAARKSGIVEARGDVVITTDVDGTYPNEQIPRLLDHFRKNRCDMVVGGGRAREKGWFTNGRTVRSPNFSSESWHRTSVSFRFPI